jgi:AcrR family transcriptional regulator
MVQTTRTAPRTARRLAILRRASDVFRRKGYHAAGMREIADGLGLRPGALYYYFESKEDLLLACQEWTLDRLIDGARRIARSGGSAAERLRALVALHLDLTLSETGGSAAHVEFRALPPARLREVVRRRDAYEALVRGVVRDGAREGRFRAVDPKAAALALLGALNWSVFWWSPEGRWTAEELAEQVSDLFLGGLLAREETA